MNTNAPNPTPDLFLARRAARADADAWNQMIAQYGEPIFNLALRFATTRAEAEDLTQDIFLKLYSNLHHYRGDVPLLAWTLRLSRNLCIDHYRHHRARLQAEVVPEEILAFLPTAEKDPQQHSQQLERRRLVHRALAKMPEGQAMVVILRDLQGFSYDELSTFFEVPVGTIKSRLNRARRALVKHLEDCLGLERPATESLTISGGASC
jgi:RNA polymerase sigma-70 factor (ECF subfamily)